MQCSRASGPGPARTSEGGRPAASSLPPALHHTFSLGSHDSARDRSDYGEVGHIGRLTYTGALDRWEFAIYRYSDERYDPDEWLFPGAEELDGTIEGTMRAGMAAYPP